MQEAITSAAPETLTCRSCSTTVFNHEAFCNTCGYPLQGTEDEQQSFMVNRVGQQIDLEEHDKQVKSASTTLFVLAGLTVLSGAFELFTNDNPSNATAIGIFYCIVVALFIGLGLWSRKKPTAAIISGLCLYIVMLLLAAIADPVNIVRGVIMKIVIIGYLIKGIKSSMEADRMIKEHNLSRL
jgi:ribosomal protein L37E